MKRTVIVLLLTALLLTGCGYSAISSYTKNVDGHQLRIYEESNSILYGEHIYNYAFTDDGVSITYPNGAICTQKYGTVSWENADADFIIQNGAPYIDCYTLLKAVPSGMGREWTIDGWMIMFGVVVLLVGLFEAGAPELSWEWSHGWKFRNAEPSDLYLGLSRVGGVIVAIVGIVMILIGIFA